MKPYTLVVIDVQPGFKRTAEVVVGRIRQEMQSAIETGMGILLVEFVGQGKTLVKDAVAGYPRCWTVLKRYDSGAIEIEHALETHKLPQRVRVCGVNTGACVARTVCQLRVPQIEVVEDGCWCFTPKSHKLGLKTMRELPNVRIIPRWTAAQISPSQITAHR